MDNKKLNIKFQDKLITYRIPFYFYNEYLNMDLHLTQITERIALILEANYLLLVLQAKNRNNMINELIYKDIKQSLKKRYMALGKKVLKQKGE